MTRIVKKEANTEKILAIALEVGELTAAKNEVYGDSFGKCGDFMRLLYPDGMRPEQFSDALLLARIFDKCMRIATRKGAFDESPYRDLVGYGLLGALKDQSFHCCDGIRPNHSPYCLSDRTAGSNSLPKAEK